MWTAVEQARAGLPVVKPPCPEDLEITDVLGEQAAAFRPRQLQYLGIGKPRAPRAFDECDDVMPPLAETLGE